MTLLILLGHGWASLDLKEFAGILVYDEGRIKPIDTLARSLLLRFNGTSTFKGKSEDGEKIKLKAIDWFAQVVFESKKTTDYQIFKVNHPEVLNALGIQSKNRRFSFNQFRPSFATLDEIARGIWGKEKKYKEQTGSDYKRNHFEKEFMRLYQNLNTYYIYTKSFEFALPRDFFNIPDKELKRQLNLDENHNHFSFLELMENVHLLKKMANSLTNKKKEQFSENEKTLAILIDKYSTYPKLFVDNPIALLPSVTHNEPLWLSPWKVLAFESSVNLVKNEIKLLQLMVVNYKNGRQGDFDKAVKDFKLKVNTKVAQQINLNKPKLELYYNRLEPFFWAKFFYGLAMVIGLFSFILLKRPFRWGGLISLHLGLFMNVLGIVMRMYINSRPPITNLFETFVFVSAVGVGLCFFVEKYNQRGLGLISGSFSGLTLMLISGRFGLDGDTIQVMQAVLDSNFWLATHVVTINLGYAGVVISGVIAHFYLIQKLRQKENVQELGNIIKMVYGTLAFGFIFVFVGTVLGGIWADQSWGRFWGWDPKENGALLIALWCAILFHARLGGLIKEVIFAAGAIFGIVVVMWAWFGINLLGVGLHSYGFIDGVFNRLVIYSLLQVTFILGMLSIILGKEHKENNVN